MGIRYFFLCFEKDCRQAWVVAESARDNPEKYCGLF